MSITSPPRPPREPLPQPPDGPAVPPTPPLRAGSNRRARALAVGALALVVLVIALLVFGGGGGANYKLLFENAGQLVRGDQVQVGGSPVGSVTGITLTHNYQALVTIHVDSPLAPLHKGTTAQIRVPSLSGVANRYIDLSPGPNSAPTYPSGATLPASVARGVVDIDQVFDTLNAPTRKGLQGLIHGFAEQYDGVEHDVNVSSEFFAPALAAADHVFAEIGRDQHTLTEFLVQTSKAMTTIATHGEQLSGFVEHANTAFAALSAHQADLVQGVQQLPVALHAGNQTFANLPATDDALRQLLAAAKPNTHALAQLLANLRPLFVEGTPVVTELGTAINKPGPNNDLTDALRTTPSIARLLEAAEPQIVEGLKQSSATFSRVRAYTPDFVGAARGLGQSTAYYDGNGHYVRAGANFSSFALGPEDVLTPVSSLQQALQTLKTGQLRRCPGGATQPAADGSSPYTDAGALECNPSEVP